MTGAAAVTRHTGNDSNWRVRTPARRLA